MGFFEALWIESHLTDRDNIGDGYGHDNWGDSYENYDCRQQGTVKVIGIDGTVSSAYPDTIIDAREIKTMEQIEQIIVSGFFMESFVDRYNILNCNYMCEFKPDLTYLNEKEREDVYKMYRYKYGALLYKQNQIRSSLFYIKHVYINYPELYKHLYEHCKKRVWDEINYRHEQYHFNSSKEEDFKKRMEYINDELSRILNKK